MYYSVNPLGDQISALFKCTNIPVRLSPPAARLCTKSARVLVPSNKINKVVEHSDALVGHSRCVSGGESPPLLPAWVENLKRVLAVWVGGAEHPPEAQYTVEGGARLGEGALQDWLQDLLLVVMQGG